MSLRGNNIAVRYSVDYADKGTRELLREDRRVRTAIQQTSATMAQSARRAATASAQSVNAARRQATAQQHTGQAGQQAARGVDAAARASRQAANAQSKEAVTARRVAQSYDQVDRAARRAAGAQRRAATSGGRGGSGAPGGAVAGAAGFLRGPAAGAAAAAGLGLTALVSAGVSFEKQMDRVGAVAGATRRQLAAMNKQAIQLGADTQFSAKQAADGMYQLSTAGFTANETMKIIPGTLDLAAASGVDLADAAALQASAIRGFGLSAKDAGRVADVLAKTVNSSAVEMADLGETLPYVASTAKQTGTSFEQVAAAAGILGNAGIKGSMAGTALRTSMLRLTDPSKKMQGVFERMGVDASKLAAVPLPEVIGRVAEGIKKLPTQGEKVGAISAIFGKEAAPSMLNLMSKGRKGIDELVKSLEHSRGTAKETAKDMRDNVAGGWDQFTGSVETSGIALESKFQVPLKDALNGAARFTNELTKGLVGGKATTGIEKFGTVLRGAAQSAGQAIGKIIGALKPAQPFLRNVVGPLVIVNLKLFGATWRVVGTVVSAAVRVMATALGWLGSRAPGAVKALTNAARSIGSVFATAFRAVAPIVRTGLRVITTAFAGIAAVITTPARLGFRVLRTIFTTGVRVLGPIVRAGLNVIKAYWTVLTTLLSQPARLAWRLVKAAFNAAKGPIAAAARAVASAAVDAFGWVRDKIAQPVSSGIGKAVGVLKDGVHLVSGPAHAIASAISGAFSGVAGGISTAFGGIVDSLRNRINDIIGVINTAIRAFNKLPGGDIGEIGLIGGGGPARSRWTGQARPHRAGGATSGLALVSPGELAMFPDGRTAIIPGQRAAADNVLAAFPRDTMIFTDDGQQKLAAGATTGQALATQLPHFAKGGVFGASMYGVGERGTGTKGYRGDYLPGKMAFAELGMGKALGGLPHRAKLEITYKGRSVVASKLDIGRGGAPVRGHPRAIDLWRDTAKALRFPGLDLVSATSGTGKRLGGTRGPGGSTRLDLPPKLSFGTGLQGPVGAFQSGFEAGIEGTPLWESANVADIVSAARARLERRSKTISNRSLGSAGAVAGPKAFRSMVARADSISRHGYPYRYGGGHGSFRGPYDCSGAVSAVLHAGGLLKAPTDTTGLKGFGAAGGGKLVTIGVRGSSGRSAHTMMRLGNRYFESGSGHGAKWVSGWSGNFPIKRHPRGLRRGGIIGGGLAQVLGTNLPGGAVRALTDPSSPAFVGWGLRRGGLIAEDLGAGSLGIARGRIGQLADLPTASNRVKLVVQRLAGVLDNAEEISYGALERLQRSIARQIKTLRRHGVTQREQVQIRRLSAADRLISTEMGRRTGLIVRSVDQQKEAMERGRTRLGQLLRRRGVDEASAAGVSALRDLTRTQIGQLKGMETSLLKALRRARKVHDRQAVTDITDRLKGIRDDLAETSTSWIEQAREAIRAVAQQQVDIAAHGATIAGIGLQRLELQQRLAGTFETGGAARALYIRSTVLPALQNEAATLRGQWDAAAQTGDIAGARQKREEFEQKQLDIMQAQLDAQEQTAENTEPLKDFTGTTAFEAFGERWTDRLLGSLAGT